MGRFGIIKFYLKTIYETFLAYAKARLLLVDGKNSLFENSCLLTQNLIKYSSERNYCWRKSLVYLERDLIVGGKDLKIGGIELNNWWKENIILVGQSSVLCKRLIKLFFCIFVRNF